MLRDEETEPLVEVGVYGLCSIKFSICTEFSAGFRMPRDFLVLSGSVTGVNFVMDPQPSAQSGTYSKISNAC